jgi:hypothetical protein
MLDEALEAAEMGPWRYLFADQSVYLSQRAQELYGITGAVETSEPVIRSAGHKLSVVVPDRAVWVNG